MKTTVIYHQSLACDHNLVRREDPGNEVTVIIPYALPPYRVIIIYLVQTLTLSISAVHIQPDLKLKDNWQL